MVCTVLLSSCGSVPTVKNLKLPNDACQCYERQQNLMSRGMYLKDNGAKAYIDHTQKSDLSGMNDTYQANSSEYKPLVSSTIIIPLSN